MNMRKPVKLQIRVLQISTFQRYIKDENRYLQPTKTHTARQQTVARVCFNIFFQALLSQVAQCCLFAYFDMP
jgi:hypothetical protein